MMTQTWVEPCSAAKLKQSWTSTITSWQANSKLREYYEGMLSEAKRNKEQHISEAVDKAVNDKVQEIQVKLENLIVEKKKVAEMNEKLTRSQDVWRQTLRDIEETERAQ